MLLLWKNHWFAQGKRLNAGALIALAWKHREAQHLKVGYRLSKRVTTWPTEPQQELGCGCLGISPDGQYLFHLHKTGVCFIVPTKVSPLLC